ncbi:hypothetical protein Syun_001257 [Stephania yunnanensis]|uniref:Uncharacterized protein n=1 Tax=Stephania yunnanensis TaxID=152371 RepID=A0AAP0Q636_9MAGN
MAGRGRRGGRGLPLGGHRGGGGRGSIPPSSIPTSRSLEHDTAAASPSPSIPSGSSVPSSSSSRTMPTTHFPTPSPTSMTPLPTRPAPPPHKITAASREEDVRAGLEVTGPPRPPQRPGMEAPRVQGIPITLIANDTELHPSHFCARRMTKVFKRWMIPEGYCWKSVPPHQKDQYWRQWKIFFRWDDALPEDLVRAAYDRLAGTRYTALMHKLKKNRARKWFYVTDEAWRRYLQYWESEDFQARSRQATENRNTEVEGPGTGPSKHGGGSVSFATTQERLVSFF